ncbi:neutral and basic amino acid transport protein rBAT isoform X2 [Leptidea sinapis]|nr:neutral and basic amino acid transport protein rBAT isoform X2 [Leptidea sinapis]
MADAKYVVGDHRNGDAKIELDANKRQFVGLTKEELMKYADDPFWVRLRWFMFVLFWALWVGMLVGAVTIIVLVPKCAAPPPRTWFEKGPLVDLSSEDLQAVEADLPLMQSAHVAGAFVVPCKDSYEVLEDNSSCLQAFKDFVGKAKKLGVKVIVDLTANFVSTSHQWFQLSENRSEPFSNYFLWAPGKDLDEDQNSELPDLPQKWVPTPNHPAWTWSDKRKEFYLHQFGADLPDLNFSNQDVVKHFDDVITRWMKAGADGIRLNKTRHMAINSQLGKEQPRVSESPGEVPLWSDRLVTDGLALRELLAHWAHLTDLAATPPSLGESVFTLAETADVDVEAWLNRNASLPLRPPCGAPLTVAAGDAAVAAASTINRYRKLGWIAIQLKSAEKTDDELAAFSLLLPAAPVWSTAQLRDADNGTVHSKWLEKAVSLRNDASVMYGVTVIDTVTAVRDTEDGDNSTVTLLACTRWQAGHKGYVAVYNPSAEAARARLAPLAPHLPARLEPFYWSPRTFGYTNYTFHTAVDVNNALVPPRATVLFSFIVDASAAD